MCYVSALSVNHQHLWTCWWRGNNKCVKK